MSCAAVRMGKNSNVHKRQSFHEADLQREREEEQRRVAKKEKMQAYAIVVRRHGVCV